MSYRTLRGRDVKHPCELQLAASKLKPEKFREEALNYADQIREMYDSLMYAEQKALQLQQENTRLKHENEFMLRLINERGLSVISLIKKILCKHKHVRFIRNIHGDEIIEYGYKRSVYVCINCGKYFYKDQLYEKEIYA